MSVLHLLMLQPHYLECSEEIAPMTKIIVRLIFRKNTTTKPRVTVLIVIFIALFHSGVLLAVL